MKFSFCLQNQVHIRKLGFLFEICNVIFKGMSGGDSIIIGPLMSVHFEYFISWVLYLDILIVDFQEKFSGDHVTFSDLSVIQKGTIS